MGRKMRAKDRKSTNSSSDESGNSGVAASHRAKVEKDAGKAGGFKPALVYISTG